MEKYILEEFNIFNNKWKNPPNSEIPSFLSQNVKD